MFVYLIFAFISLSRNDTLYAPHFNMPIMPYNMSYSEYRTLVFDFDVMDYMTGVFFPGYFHYMIGEKKNALGIFTLRSMGTALSVAGGVLLYGDAMDLRQSPATYKNKIMKDMGMIMTGFLFNAFLYMLDLGHARWVLRERKFKVFYKYGIYEH